MKKFIGRGLELQWLENDHNENISHFAIVYGRRRVGKSALIERFCEGKRAFSFQGGREKKAPQIKRFLKELSEFMNEPLIAMAGVTTWDEVITIFNNKRGPEKIILVLDEFQWMCEGSPELLSDIQRNWDKLWKNGNDLFLILCGSSISFMTGEVLSEKSPLFGRRTREIFLEPFPANEAALFFPERSDTEKAEALMMLGGIPMYLASIKENTSIRKNINSLAFSKGGLFVNEVKFVLSEQLKETGNYFRLLNILATGPKSLADLAREMRISTGQTQFYLHRLETLKFVQKHIPITKELNSKSIRFKLADEFLRFYFYYIEPNNARILNNAGDHYLFERMTGSSWDTFCGLAFEMFCEKNVSAILKKLNITDTVERIGTYWQKKTSLSPGVQIDMVIECSDKTTFLIECKWSKNKVGVGIVEELTNKERLYPNPKGHTLKKVVIASHGITAEAAKETALTVLTLHDLFQ